RIEPAKPSWRSAIAACAPPWPVPTMTTSAPIEVLALTASSPQQVARLAGDLRQHRRGERGRALRARDHRAELADRRFARGRPVLDQRQRVAFVALAPGERTDE